METSEKTRENRLKTLELKLKILEKDNTGETKFGEKESKELVMACTGAIKNAEGFVYLLRTSNQFPLANNTGVNEMVENADSWSTKNIEKIQNIFMTHLGQNTNLLTNNYVKIFTGEKINDEIIRKFGDILAEQGPENRIKLEELCSMAVQGLRELLLEMANPSGLSQSSLMPKLLTLKSLIFDIYGEETEILKHIKKCLRILEQTRPNAGDIYDNLVMIIPECLNNDEGPIHRGLKNNQDRRFIEWGDSKLKMETASKYLEMNIFHGVTNEIYTKFSPNDDNRPVRQHRGEQNDLGKYHKKDQVKINFQIKIDILSRQQVAADKLSPTVTSEEENDVRTGDKRSGPKKFSISKYSKIKNEYEETTGILSMSQKLSKMKENK
jgi:hypothetical protein